MVREFGEGFDKTILITKVEEEAVMRLLKEQRISQGKASELLGVDRYDLFDLMAQYMTSQRQTCL